MEAPAPAPRSRKRGKWILLAVIGLLFLIVVADALGVFNKKPYTAIPHGNHVHYVPKDRDPAVPVGEFPTQEPAPGERITPKGQVVRDGS